MNDKNDEYRNCTGIDAAFDDLRFLLSEVMSVEDVELMVRQLNANLAAYALNLPTSKSSVE